VIYGLLSSLDRHSPENEARRTEFGRFFRTSSQKFRKEGWGKKASGYAPSNAFESAIIADVAPGNYTAIVCGVNNTTRVALVEVYDLDHPLP
jgi:hypothetical protein